MRRRSARPLLEIARLSANPHFVFWALCELAWACYFSGDLDATIAAGDESVRVGGRMSGGTDALVRWRAPVGRWRWPASSSASSRRRCRLMREVGGEDLENWMPAEHCFNWENLALVELALGNAEEAERDRTPRRSNRPAEVDLRLPTALAARTRAAVQLASGDTAGAARAAERVDRGGRGDRSPVPGRVLAQPARAARWSRPATARVRSRCCGRPSASSTPAARCGCATWRGVSCASSAPAPRRAGRARPTTPGSSRCQQARARGQRPDHGADDEQADRRPALPQREDDRVAPAQHLQQARRVVARGGRPRDGARPARARSIRRAA